MASLPTGTATFLVIDIEGSCRVGTSVPAPRYRPMAGKPRILAF